MIYDHRTARDMWTPGEFTYEHNVIPFPGPVARANASQAAQAVEDDRVTFEVRPDRVEERRLWNAYMAAIRKQVAMNDEVDAAHRAWMKAAGQLPNSTR